MKDPQSVPSSSPVHNDALSSSVNTVPVRRWENGVCSQVDDQLANEVPIAISYQGISHVVMLATPVALEELAIGFTLTEGLVTDLSEIRAVNVVQQADSISVNLNVAPERFSEILTRQRHMSGRTGCGLCGSATLDDAIRRPPSNAATQAIDPMAIQSALQNFSTFQPINAQTGSVHAAAWVKRTGVIETAYEDVGRHNALDKLIGHLVTHAFDANDGFVLLSSRASFELIQKAAMVGISVVVAVSAPTAFAIRTAHALGVTVVGFARSGRQVIYSHPERIRG